MKSFVNSCGRPLEESLATSGALVQSLPISGALVKSLPIAKLGILIFLQSPPAVKETLQVHSSRFSFDFKVNLIILCWELQEGAAAYVTVPNFLCEKSSPKS